MSTIEFGSVNYYIVLPADWLEDKGTAINFLMMSGERSWSPASAAVGEK